MVFEQTKDEDGTTKIKKDEIYDADGDGRESVSEYIEKKKIMKKPEEEEEQKSDKKKNGDEDLKKALNIAKGVGSAVGNVAGVLGKIPKFSAIGLGTGFAGLAKIIAEGIANNGKNE